MKHINVDIDEVLSYDSKRALLKEIEQEDLFEVFKEFKNPYKPIVRKKSPLDQHISFGITKVEKELLTQEIKEIKRGGNNITISAFVRSRAVGEIDIQAWRERALMGLKELSGKDWDRRTVTRDINRTLSMLDNIDDDDAEEQYMLNKKLKELNEIMEELDRPTERRGFRLSGRVTFNEANHIRWRAARLTLTVADYMRFLIFGHEPFTDADRHMSVDARKRFYISVLDIAENGWGETPHIENCPNCARYAEETQVYKEKLERLQKLSR